MKNMITFILLLLPLVNVISQSYFNRTFYFEDGPPRPVQIFNTDSNYVISIINFRHDTVSTSSIFLIKKDFQSTQIKIVPYHSFVRNTPLYYEGKYYAFCNYKKEAGYLSFIRYSKDFEPEIIKRYPALTPWLSGGSAMTMSHGYVFGASIDEYRDMSYIRYNLNIRKIDTTGKLVWVKQYNLKDKNPFPLQITPLRDSSLILAKAVQAKYRGEFYPELMKISEDDGQVIWSMRGKRILPFLQRQVNAIELKDGTILMDYVSYQEDSIQIENTAHYWEWYEPKTGELLRDSVLYEKRYTRTASYQFVKGRGPYYFYLGKYDGRNGFYGFIEKYSDSGARIWRHLYQLPGEPKSHPYLWDLEETGMGDILAVRAIDEHWWDVWMLRLNAGGCLGNSVECREELVTVGTKIPLLELHPEEILLVPNPSSGVYRFAEEKLQQIQRIRILSMDGNQWKVIKDVKDNIIDISLLPSGMYSLRFEMKSGEVVVEKVVKE